MLVCTQGFPRHLSDHHAPFIADHAAALADAGATVTVLCPSGPGLARTERRGQVTVVRFRYAPRRLETLAYTGALHRRAASPAGLLLPLFVLGYLGAVVRLARSADVLHAHWWAPSGLVAVVAGRITRTPVVVHIHGTDAAIARGPLRSLARWTLRSADAVLVVSDDLASWVTRISGVAAVVAPMPISPERVPAPSPAPEDGPVLAVGRLVPEKGFDVLIRAAAVAGVRVEIVGDGDQSPSLRSLARAVGAHVDFLGSLAPSELAARYAAARIVAVPSRREGFGLVAAEAAAAGRAVVASDVGGLRSIVDDGRTGVLVPADDVSALADALRAIDPRLGLAGPVRVAHLGPADAGRRALRLYERVVRKPTKGSDPTTARSG